MGSPDRPATRSPLQAALDRELHALDRFIAQVWLSGCAFGTALGLFLAATVSPRLGLVCTAVALPYVAWFGFILRRSRRGPLPRALIHLSGVIEASVPWVFFLVLLLVQGAAYALASWVPPMLFCMAIFGLTVRLRSTSALLAGAVGAVTFLALHLFVARPALPPDLAALVVYQLEVQVSRTFSIVAIAGMAAVAARGMRHALERADVSAREIDLFGKYRLVREIAKGGMAAVFEAVYCPEGGFERKVAIKRIHPHLAEQERFVDFFRSEAAISSRLSHPNIVQVLDFGRVDGKYFLSMEFVDGVTLWALSRAAKGPLPVGVVAALGVEILAGLEHAHRGARAPDGRALRVVHRDLCPQNVLLSTNGEVKITDFGVARALRDAGTDQTNTVVGHLGYISPEQARGEAVDTRSDLFAVGVILWELLVGASLFRRDNDAATLGALIYDPIPPASHGRAEVTAEWDTFFARALERDPELRFQTAGEMALALLALPGADDPTALSTLASMVRTRVAPEVDADGDAVTRVETTVPTGRHRAVSGD